MLAKEDRFVLLISNPRKDTHYLRIMIDEISDLQLLYIAGIAVTTVASHRSRSSSATGAKASSGARQGTVAALLGKWRPGTTAGSRNQSTPAARR